MSKDLAASVRARLLNIAKAEGTDFNQILVRYALERILYRFGSTSSGACVSFGLKTDPRMLRLSITTAK